MKSKTKTKKRTAAKRLLSRKPKSKKTAKKKAKKLTLPGMDKAITPRKGIHFPGMKGTAKVSRRQATSRFTQS